MIYSRVVVEHKLVIKVTTVFALARRVYKAAV